MPDVPNANCLPFAGATERDLLAAILLEAGGSASVIPDTAQCREWGFGKWTERDVLGAILIALGGSAEDVPNTNCLEWGFGKYSERDLLAAILIANGWESGAIPSTSQCAEWGYGKWTERDLMGAILLANDGDPADITSTALCAEWKYGRYTKRDLLAAILNASAVPFVGPLDPFEADINGIWSPTARLLMSYEGPLIRIRRSSDNAEQDIGFTTTGAVDIAAALTFIGGGTGYITTIYDQSGTANDLTQATAANQPIIDEAVTAWGGLPAAVFAGSQFLDFDTAISPTSLFMGVHSTSSSGLGRYCVARSGNSSMFELGVQSAYGRWENTDGQVNVLFADQAIGHGLEMWYNAGSSIIRIDTAEEPSAATLPLANIDRVGAYDATPAQPIFGSITYMVALDAFYNITDRAAFRAALASVFPFAV